MVSAILSVLLGLIPFIFPVPVVLSVIGAALGANALIKESNAGPESRNPKVKGTAIAGTVLCCLAIALFFIGRYLAL